MNENKNGLDPVTEQTDQNEQPEVTEEVQNIEIVSEEPVDSPVLSEEAEKIQNEMKQVTEELQKKVKTYKISLGAVVILIAAYLIALFTPYLKNWILAICILMIIAAIINTVQSRKIQKLATERAQLNTKLKKLQEPDVQSGDLAAAGGMLTPSDPVTDIDSLNKLPREYTVLDDVDFSGNEASQVIVSPYGIAIVSDQDVRPDVEAILQELNIESPVFLYEPEENISDLAMKIQSEHNAVLNEQQIMTILQKMLGLK